MAELGFVFHVHPGDVALGRRLARQIREYYPAAPAVCIGDGYSDYEFEQLMTELRIRFVSSAESWKTAPSGWRWTNRFIAHGYELGCDRFLRIDSDSKLHRHIKGFPDADMFGHVAAKNNPAPWPFVTGGCIGMTRDCADKIVRSKVLRRPIYANARRFSYPRYGHALRHPNETRNSRAYYLDDVALGHVAQDLGLSLARWGEVQIRFRGRPTRQDKAITHPWPADGKVFGIGLPRTGTTSLAAALRELGYYSQHWPAGKGAANCKALVTRAQWWDAFTDHPCNKCYQELHERYPEAKFVLGVRDYEAWERSMLFNFTRAELAVFSRAYGNLSDWWTKHLADVAAFFSDKPGKLLLHNPADGWGPLCEFLGKPVPRARYPHQNKVRGKANELVSAK